MPEFEYLREDDPDYLMLKGYKAAHGINRDCNDPDVIVMMRRARAAERRANVAALTAAIEALIRKPTP